MPHTLPPTTDRRQYHTMRLTQVVDDGLTLIQQGRSVAEVARLFRQDGVPLHVTHRVLLTGKVRKAWA